MNREPQEPPVDPAPEVSAAIRQHATRHVAPPALRAALLARAALAEAGRAAQPADRCRPWQAALATRGRTAAAGFAAGVALTMLATLALAPAPPLFEPLLPARDLAGELTALHVRALQLGPLTEVSSSDRHTVKPWFQGRLDYAPPVHDLADQGFALSGGRVATLRGQAVAALVYARRRHQIDVFVWPGDGRAVSRPAVRRGYNVVEWTAGAMQYAAVSDLDAAELQGFARLLAQRATGP